MNKKIAKYKILQDKKTKKKNIQNINWTYKMRLLQILNAKK